MNFISILTSSSAVMWLVTFVCAVMCIRCLIYGMIGGTSLILRILLTIAFGALAYYCWTKAGVLTGSNAIDRFVFDVWHDIRGYVSAIKSYIF